MTDKEVIAAIRKNHLKANIAKFERDPKFWGLPMWSKAWVDGGGTIFGAGPYLHVPIRGGDFDGTVQRVYAPARLQRQLAKRWSGTTDHSTTVVSRDR